MSDPFVVLGDDLQVLAADRAFFEIFDLSPEQVEGASFLELHPEGWNLSEERLQAVLAEEETIEGVKMETTGPEGDPRILLLTAKPLVSAETGSASGRLLVVMEDVTERRSREEERRKEAEEMDRFLTVLGHELRNPMAPIQNGLDLLRSGALEAEDREQVLGAMDRQVGLLQRLVDDFLNLSRIASGEISLEMERVDLGRVVGEAVEDHRRELEAEGRRLTVESPGKPIWVEADETGIHQVVENLLNNALKFTSLDDRITVGVRHTGDGGAAVLSVADTGEGMSEDILGWTLKPFRGYREAAQKIEQGLGTGLMVVREIVERHGGTVTAESEGVGRGSTVAVRLPTPDLQGEGAEGRRGGSGTSDERDLEDSLRILLVEDQAAGAAMMRMLLENEGHEVTVVQDGETAVRMAHEIAPDLVLCDLGLPGEMDGGDVAESLRSSAELPDLRLVALSGFREEKDQQRARAADFDAYLVKPVGPDELGRTFAELFAGSNDNG